MFKSTLRFLKFYDYNLILTSKVKPIELTFDGDKKFLWVQNSFPIPIESEVKILEYFH